MEERRGGTREDEVKEEEVNVEKPRHNPRRRCIDSAANSPAYPTTTDFQERSLSVQPLSPATHTRPRDSTTFSTSTDFLSSLSLSLLYFFFLERVRARERARENASGRMGGLRWPTSSKMWGVDLAQRRSPDPFPLSRLEIVSIRTSPFKSRLKFAPLEMIKDDGQSDGSNPRRSPFFLLRFSCESFCELIKNH